MTLDAPAPPQGAAPPSRVLLVALALAFLVSTQFLFQPFVWRHWSADEVLRGWLEVLQDRAVVAACMALGFVLARRFGRGASVFVLGLGIGAGAAVGEVFLMLLSTPAAAVDAAALAGRVLRWCFIAAALLALLAVWRHALHVQDRVRRHELAQLEGEAQLANLRLQALRAQIEPHFLFNTLATVRRLGATEPTQRTQLLDHLHTFIRLSLAAQPGDRAWTLAEELDLVRAYLGVVALRMDGRLRVRVRLDDDALLACPMPPLLVATLVENAVKHGITPSLAGGDITIDARREGDQLQVRVADTGVGLQASGGSGIGLANSRARLRTLYGDKASLELQAHQPQGVVALLRLPASTERAH
jgi:signal transduction histidine kinase